MTPYPTPGRDICMMTFAAACEVPEVEGIAQHGEPAGRTMDTGDRDASLFGGQSG
jgi:hypothetical protein